MQRIRSIVLSLVLASVPLSMATQVSAAGGQPVLMPAVIDVRTFLVPCAEDTTRLCQRVVTTTVSAHYELSRSSTAAATATIATCTSRKYIWPSMKAEDKNLLGIVVTKITLSAENWYDGCTAGKVWISFQCTSVVGFSCDSSSYGGFWDPGLYVYQDWGNQKTSNLFGVSVWWYLRLHVAPDGRWKRWCYNSGSGSC